MGNASFSTEPEATLVFVDQLFNQIATIKFDPGNFLSWNNLALQILKTYKLATGIAEIRTKEATQINNSMIFERALAKHQPKFRTKIQTWRDALTAAANLSGWDLGTYRKEADLIQDLVQKILSELNHTPLHVAKYPVGIDSHLRSLYSYSEHGKHLSSYMVGIYGIGGAGKTTLAKALYNKIYDQFEGSCFLSNVREASKQFNGLVQLQEKLLYEVLNEDLKAGNLDKGINIIRNRLRSKKVLIVLDDVDKLDQLEALVGEHDWFGSGSKIIVTTRNNHLLFSHEFDGKYVIQGLDHDNALELFSWHTFKKSHPSSGFVDLSERAITYCRGLPLALVVLGSFLCGRDQSKWESILDEFENSLNKDIRDILQISYDGLEDQVKEVFLDISCLFVGEKVGSVKNVLNTYHNLDSRMLVLEDLSLVTIEYDRVQMHDLIRQMGRDIVNGESSEPGKRSRLWLEQDIYEVFTQNSGTDAVKAIKLDLPQSTRLNIDPKAFRNMKNLRLLVVRNATFSTKLEHLPDNLKWIEWHGFAHPSLPSCFMKKNLVGLDLRHSFIKKLGKGFKVCERLKWADLRNSTLLEKIPDLSGASNLEKLYLSNCTNLRTIDKSVFTLDKLITLKLDGCCNLRKLPRYTLLKCLEVLDLYGCKRLEKIPDFSASSNLVELNLARCTNLRIVHESIGSLDKLIILNLSECSNLERLPSYLRLKSLEWFDLFHCRKLEKFPEIAENMKSLKSLDLDFTAIKELPASIGYLTELMELNLKGCSNLISLPSSIGYLTGLSELNLEGCSNLISLPSSIGFETFPETSCSSETLSLPLTLLDLRHCNISNSDFLQTLCNFAPSLNELLLSENNFSSLPPCLHKFSSLKILELRNCKFLREIPNLPQSIENMDASRCKSLTTIPNNLVDIISNKQDIALGDIKREFVFPDSEIPKWFSYRTTTNLIRASFRHYPAVERTLASCVVFKVNEDSHKSGARILCTIFIRDRLYCSFTRKFLPSKSEYTWLVTTSLQCSFMVLKNWNQILVWFEVVNEADVTVRSYGVHVTEELHEIQTGAERREVNYTDLYRPEKLPNLDTEANFVGHFVRKISMSLNCKAMLSATKNIHIGRKQRSGGSNDFQLWEKALYDFTNISSGIQHLETPSLLFCLNGLICFLIRQGRSHFGSFSHLKYEDPEVTIRDELSSKNYLIILEKGKFLAGFYRQLWFRTKSGFGDLYISFEFIESVDLSKRYYGEERR